MPFFTKKPVTIEAKLYTGDNLEEILEFTGKHPDFSKWFKSFEEYETHVKKNNGLFKIITLEGTMGAIPGDWIIKGVQGEFYPCKPGIFDITYEMVIDNSDLPINES